MRHGEGKLVPGDDTTLDRLQDQNLIALQYVAPQTLEVTQEYPANPNGSPDGFAGVTAADGRVLILMPHPERVFRTLTNSWYPDGWPGDGPWLRLFRNARVALS